jgi:hypothetical protein
MAKGLVVIAALLVVLIRFRERLRHAIVHHRRR